MTRIVHAALRVLNLDYTIMLISVGAGKHYEIVMWDKPRNSYFLMRVRWDTGFSLEGMTRRVVQQLAERSTACASQMSGASLNDGAAGMTPTNGIRAQAAWRTELPAAERVRLPAVFRLLVAASLRFCLFYRPVSIASNRFSAFATISVHPSASRQLAHCGSTGRSWSRARESGRT